MDASALDEDKRKTGDMGARPTPRLGRIHARFIQAPPRRVLPFGTYPAKVEGTLVGQAGMGGAIVDHLNVSSLAGADPATAAESGRSGKCFLLKEAILGWSNSARER